MALGLGCIFTSAIMIVVCHGRLKDKSVQRNAAAMLVVSLICLISFNYFVEEKHTGWDPDTMGGERIMMLEASYRMWQDHKMVGIGPEIGKSITIAKSIIPKKEERRVM